MIRLATLLLRDIDDNIGFITTLLPGRTIDDFRSDITFRYALLHAFVIIAEAVKNLPAHLKNARPDVPWSKIIGLGIILKHEYHRVDPMVIWDAATVYLPPLRATIQSMLGETHAETM